MCEYTLVQRTVQGLIAVRSNALPWSNCSLIPVESMVLVRRGGTRI